MKHAHVRTVLVVAVVAAVFAVGCSAIGLGNNNNGITVRAEFERTFNLFPGSDVRIQGIERGIVRELLVSEGDGAVTAVLRLDEDVTLPADVRAIIFTDALLGERYVQLDPPYLGEGPTFQDGDTIAFDATCPDPAQGGAEAPCTAVPAEFDEVLDALNNFAQGVETGDLPRLVDNLAEILDGNGENIGQTLEAARDAIGVLRDNDEELLALARELSDLNEVLNTRTQQVGEVVQDFAELSRVLADERVPIDRALSGLARLTDEAGRLLAANRDLLEDDVATLARVGRTAQRNLDEVSRMLLGSAELFRHAERVLDRNAEWLPLVNNTDDLTNFLLESLAERLASLCRREGVDAELCGQLRDAIDEILPNQICLPPLISCTEGEDGELLPGGPIPLDQALTDAMEETVADTPADQDPAETDQLEELVEDLVDDLDGPLFGGGGL